MARARRGDQGGDRRDLEAPSLLKDGNLGGSKGTVDRGASEGQMRCSQRYNIAADRHQLLTMLQSRCGPPREHAERPARTALNLRNQIFVWLPIVPVTALPRCSVDGDLACGRGSLDANDLQRNGAKGGTFESGDRCMSRLAPRGRLLTRAIQVGRQQSRLAIDCEVCR